MKSERSQKQKAKDLLRLHDRQELLLLPNVWTEVAPFLVHEQERGEP